MVKPFKLVVGGPIGSGKQSVSWIHLNDAVAALMLCIDDPSISGAVNVVSPNAVPNEELAHHIGAVLKRPSAISVPELALRIRFGEGADPLVSGQRAIPAVLQSKGFTWKYPTLRPALEDALG
jgi:NAD dependent epimerase/dehydratase family enzyme